MSVILTDYEKDLLNREGLKFADVMFYEPEDLAGELRFRISVERCAEIRGLMQLTSLKGLTLPTARLLYAAGITTRWEFLNMEADAIVAKVNGSGVKPWGEAERKKMAKVLTDNEELLEEI